MLFTHNLRSALLFLSGLFCMFPLISGCSANIEPDEKPIILKTQGSFAIGGTTVTHDGTFSNENFLDPKGQTAYGDNAYVF